MLNLLSQRGACLAFRMLSTTQDDGAQFRRGGKVLLSLRVINYAWLADFPMLRAFPKQAHHPVGIAGDNHQISANASEWPTSALLPISNLVHGETKHRRKVLLRQVELAADSTHVKFRRHMKLSWLRLPTRNGKYLIET